VIRRGWGWINFGDLLFDSYWWNAVWNSMRYSVLVIALTFLPPIVLAILLQEVPRGRMLFRMVYYLPAVISGLVTILLWKQFYEPTERGALNALILRIPAAGFVTLGIGLLWLLCLAFARRLWNNDMNFAAWGFVRRGCHVAGDDGGHGLADAVAAGRDVYGEPGAHAIPVR
jgi:ABC-type sugar transport system permease subunit